MNPETGALAVSSARPGGDNNSVLTIALAGNANVGKSAIFNQLTGMVQETGNWPGKTVGTREGTLSHHGRHFKIVDLPGIYSFTAYSQEEQVTREYILTRHPDVIINVLDATSLERNLYFTLQLKEMGVPLVIALNYADIARKKHIHIETDLLSDILGDPVINTVAIKGLGVHELVDAALEVLSKSRILSGPGNVRYGPEIENRITKLSEALSGIQIEYPLRWSSVKLLEGDPEILDKVGQRQPGLAQMAQDLAAEIARMHGEDRVTVIASERYALAAKISRHINVRAEPAKPLAERFDNLSLHPVLGYFLLFTIMAAILIIISIFGGWLTDVITNFFNALNPQAGGLLPEVLWNGGVVGFYASLSVALGFILPFFLILGLLGESGYLPRIAFLMDRPCHLLGLHGQASLPFIMALGCNVPACMACRVMSSKRDRLVAIFLTTLVPCSARTSVVLGLVGAFVGWYWAVGVLALQFLIIYLVGFVINRMSPNRSPGIIMEIPEYRVPSLIVVWKQAWSRFKDFLYLGVPLIVVGSLVIETLEAFNLLHYITQTLTPLTVTWLGLPAFTGMLLILGILRKEANLALLISFAGGASIASIMSPPQMVVFAIVIMLYIPCLSTIAVLWREHGLKVAIGISLAEIILALLVGGLAARILSLIF